MIRHAIWALEHEYEWAKEHLSWGPRGAPTVDRDPFWIFGGIVAGVGQTPYYSIVRASAKVDAFLLAQSRLWSPIAFRFGPGISGFQPVFRRAAPRATLFLAKGAARFIPFVGWALLAYDVYTLGKYAHRKLSD